MTKRPEHEGLGGPAQNDLVVEAYFSLHQAQLADVRVNKANLYREIGEQIGRKEGYVEMKMQNISAVLDKLGIEWARGLKPLPNFETVLVEAVQRYLDQHPNVAFAHPGTTPPLSGLVETSPPPLLSAKPIDPKLERIARRYNQAERDFQNRATGSLGEEFIFNNERDRLSKAGRSDLADRVEWTAREKGDGVGYDIRSFNHEGHDRLIEVKTTTGGDRTPFFITKTEYDVAHQNPETWRLVRLFNLGKEPSFFRLRPPLLGNLHLVVDTWRADFG